MAAVRILGIDPGTQVVGFACVEVEERAAGARDPGTAPRAMGLRVANLVRPAGGEGRVRLVEAGAVRLGRTVALGVRLARLVGELEGWIERFAPEEIALEEAFCGKSVQSALRIGEARGVVLATAYRRGLEVHEYPPARIKRRIAGHGSASKESVSRMASQAVGLPSIDGPADATDAVAVALCRVEERRSRRIVG